MKIIVSEEQYNTLKSNFLNENEELNTLFLTLQYIVSSQNN